MLIYVCICVVVGLLFFSHIYTSSAPRFHLLSFQESLNFRDKKYPILFIIYSSRIYVKQRLLWTFKRRLCNDYFMVIIWLLQLYIIIKTFLQARGAGQSCSCQPQTITWSSCGTRGNGTLSLRSTAHTRSRLYSSMILLRRSVAFVVFWEQMQSSGRIFFFLNSDALLLH